MRGLRAWWRRRCCRYCLGKGRTVYHGSGDTATLRSCPRCGTGEKLADTLIPNVRRVA